MMKWFKRALAALPLMMALNPAPRCEENRPDLRMPGRVSLTGLVPADQNLAAEPSLRDAVHRLTSKLQSDAPFDESDVRDAEDLARRCGENAALRRLAVIALRAAATRARALRDFGESLRLLDLAIALDSDATETRLQKIDLLLDQNEWYEAETVARSVLSTDAESSSALLGLGYALLRQDNARESAEILARCLAVRDDTVVREMLQRVQETLKREHKLTEERLPRFNLRYDGLIHEEIGREVLARLEEIYSVLVVEFEHEQTTTIPVTLFTRKLYHADGRAPGWSGGAFDTFDGRVRVAVDELSATDIDRLTPMLTHELTHVIVHDLARGNAPWEMQEGLAQYMEGKRSKAPARAERRTIDAQTRPDVSDAYLSALAWVEHIIELGSQRDINATLWQAGQTGDFNEAFRDVFGFDYAESHAAFVKQHAVQRQHPAVDPDGR